MELVCWVFQDGASRKKGTRDPPEFPDKVSRFLSDPAGFLIEPAGQM